MKKLLLLAVCFSILDLSSQVFTLKSLPASGVISRKEGGSQINIDVRNSMPMNPNMAVRFSLNGKNSGAVVSADLTALSSTGDTIQFNNNDTIRRFTFRPVLDGVTEGNDTFVFKITQAVTMGSIGSPDSVVVVITDSTAAPISGRPLYSIGAIRGTNKDGIPDSIGKSCSIRGTLYGVNRRTTGYRMFICDGTGCMGMFSGKNYALLGSVQEGDSVEISGYINEFRGLGQIEFNSTGDTIRKLGFNSNLRTPMTVTALNENSEAYLVKVEKLTLKSGTWFADSAFDLIMTNPSNTEFSVRIENKPSSNFSATPLIKSGETYTITGLGSQFDQASSAPFTKGYQLLPRKSADILKVASSISNSNQDLNVNIFPTLVRHNMNIYLESKVNEMANIQITDIVGKPLRKDMVKLINGENILTIDDLEKLPVGNYFIHLQTASFQIFKQFSIVK